MAIEVTTQAVVAFLRKQGFPIAKIGKDMPGARVRKVGAKVGVGAYWPLDPARCTSERARLKEALAEAFILEPDEHRIIVVGRKAP